MTTDADKQLIYANWQRTGGIGTFGEWEALGSPLYYTPPPEPEPEVIEPEVVEPEVSELEPEPPPEPEPVVVEEVEEEPPPEPVTAPPPEPVVEVIPAPEGYETVVKDDVTYYVKGETTLRQYGDKLVSVLPLEYRKTEQEKIIEKYGVTGTRTDVTPESVTTEGMQPYEILIAMRDAGADAATLIDYINANPEARRGAAAGQLVRGLSAQLGELGEKIGEERVATARTLGVLPEGFDELPQELKTAYAEGDKPFSAAVEVYNKEIVARQAEVQTVLNKLAPFRDAQGNYELQRAFDEGRGADVYEARALGIFTPEDIVAAQFGAIKARGIARDIEKAAKERDAREVIITGIKEIAPGVITTEDRVTTVDGVTTTTTVTSVVLEEALLAGVTEATLIEAGFDPAQIRVAADFVATNTFLTNSNEWMANDVIASVKEQSEYGYNILIEQGTSAYNTAIDSALAEMAEYERPSGYRLKPAVAAGVEKTTLSLLFPKEDVEDAWRVKREPEIAPEVEAKPVSGLPVGLVAALPVMGAVAVAEPTLIGEIIVGGAILTAVGIAIAQGQDIKWGALWDDITGAFKKETGREPTTAEVAELETTAASIISVTAIPVVDMPQAVALKVAEPIPVSPPPFPAKLLEPIAVPPFPIVKPIPLLPPDFPRMELEVKVPPFPIAEPIPVSPPPFPARIEPVLPQIIAAQAQVAIAEKELDDIFVIIRPKILKPGEFLPATVPKTETALVALDEAVGEAYAAGEIDADTLRVYSQARTNYLTKKGLLDAASKAYIGGMQPELISTTQELAASALILALSDIQAQANKVAIEAYNQALAQGATQAQAQQVAQTAAQNAIQTASQTAIQQAIKEATQNAIKTATQTMTKTAAKTATKALTKAATQTAVQTMVNTAVNTATATMTQTAVATATGVPIPIPPPKVEDKEKKKEVEQGSIAFKMGMFWKYIPPPWNMDKPVTLPRGVAPKGARLGRTPQETIQMIGRSRAIVPESISIDLGIVDAFITKRGTQIEFRGKGELTDVGERIPLTTQGMSVDGAYPGMPVASQGISRPKISKKKPKRVVRRRDDFSDILEIRGEI